MLLELKRSALSVLLGVACIFTNLSQSNATNELVSNATNPAAALIQLQLQDLVTPSSYGPGVDGSANTFIVQPVYPIVLGPDHYFQSIITRTTIPYVSTADIGGVTTNGLGDTTILGVPIHKANIGTAGDFIQWGPVGAAQLPTATNKKTGSGKWSAGGGGLLIRNIVDPFTQGDSLLVGVLGYNVWSFAETRNDSADVNKLFFQPLVVYHFNEFFGEKGWYTGLVDDLMEYDWKAKKFTQVPVGARLGKVFAVGKQPINIFGQAWYNAAKTTGSPEWTMKVNVTFLFPE